MHRRSPVASNEDRLRHPLAAFRCDKSSSIGVTAMTERIVEVEAGEIEIETIGQEIVLATPVSFDDLAMTVGQARLLAAALLAAASEAEGR